MITLSPLPLPQRQTRSRSRSVSRSMITREPLSTLPITSFIPPANTLPSPISLSTKRGPSTSTEDIGGRVRKVSRTEKETPKAEGSKKTPTATTGRSGTPKRVVLDRDELGTGKSPARRLFTSTTSDEGRRISGISGAIASPNASPSRHHNLAPSSPPPDSPRASSSTSPFVSTSSHEPSAFGLEGIEGDSNISIHDVGFIIHPDPPSTSTGMRTPRSLRATHTTQTPTPTISLPSSPSRTEHELENQENIPPPPSTSTSTSYPSPKSRTPSKYESDSDVSAYLSVRSPSGSLSGSGSGTRRRERSKLVNEVYVMRGEAARVESQVVEQGKGEEGDEEEGEELTPGRKMLSRAEKGKARELLAQEVDAI